MAKAKRVVEPKTKFYKDTAGDWRWQIKKGSHIIGASTEGYKNRIDCLKNYYDIHIATSMTIIKVSRELFPFPTK